MEKQPRRLQESLEEVVAERDAYRDICIDVVRLSERWRTERCANVGNCTPIASVGSSSSEMKDAVFKSLKLLFPLLGEPDALQREASPKTGRFRSSVASAAPSTQALVSPPQLAQGCVASPVALQRSLEPVA